MKRRQARGGGAFGWQAVGGSFAWLFACVLLDGLLELCLVVCFKLPAEPIRNIRKADFSPAEGSFRSARISGQLLWLSCLSMHVHACRCCPLLKLLSCALSWPLNSRPVSCQSRPRTLVFPGKTFCFVVEVQDSN
jgi:hypothetical protein